MRGVRENVSLDETIAFLNGLLALDHDAVRDLVELRVGCSSALGDHPSVQVVKYESDREEFSEHRVGVLGILNGLFGADEDGWGQIVAVFEDDGTLSLFRRKKPEDSS